MKRTCNQTQVILAAAMGLAVFGGVSVVPAAATVTWKSSIPTGNWNVGTNWGGDTAPTNGDLAAVSNADATITITATGPANVADRLLVRNGHTATFNFDTGSLLSIDGQIYTGDASGDTTGSTALFKGPSSGTADLHISYINPTYDTGTASSIIFSGSGLHVASNGGANRSDITNGNNVTITDGASYVGTYSGSGSYSGGYFRVRDGASAPSTSRLTIDNGSLAASTLLIGQGSNTTVEGLLQLGQNGVLKASDAAHLGLTVYQDGRFEAQGTGLDATVNANILGALAVGMDDSTPASLTINGDTKLGKTLEIGLFANGSNDTIDLSSLSTASLNANGVALQLLTPTNYTPVAGDSWTLFTGDTSKITGSFDLSQINSAVYDISDFN